MGGRCGGQEFDSRRFSCMSSDLLPPTFRCSPSADCDLKTQVESHWTSFVERLPSSFETARHPTKGGHARLSSFAGIVLAQDYSRMFVVFLNLFEGLADELEAFVGVR